jgi:hypothetical protein
MKKLLLLVFVVFGGCQSVTFSIHSQSDFMQNRLELGEKEELVRIAYYMGEQATVTSKDDSCYYFRLVKMGSGEVIRELVVRYYIDGMYDLDGMSKKPKKRN